MYSMSPSPTPAPEHKFGSPSHWDSFMIALVAAVCIIVILVSYYRTLRQLCCVLNGAAFSRNQVQRRSLGLDEAIFDDPSLQFHSHGLASPIVRSLPITQFKMKNEEELRTSDNECAVCLSEFQDGESLKHLPNCTHVFHIACIDIWFQSHSNCPICRSHIYDLSPYHECSDSMHTLLETLRREDFLQEREAHHQVLRSLVLQNAGLRNEN